VVERRAHLAVGVRVRQPPAHLGQQGGRLAAQQRDLRLLGKRALGEAAGSTSRWWVISADHSRDEVIDRVEVVDRRRVRAWSMSTIRTSSAELDVPATRSGQPGSTVGSSDGSLNAPIQPADLVQRPVGAGGGIMPRCT
jgi:hypothetical protein